MFPVYQLVEDELFWVESEGWQYRVTVNKIPIWFHWTQEMNRNPEFRRRFDLLTEGRAKFAERCQDLFSPDRMWFR